MCELKEEMPVGFEEGAESDRTEDDEEGGWMLSAYCGAEVLKKEYFHAFGGTVAIQAQEKEEAQNHTCIVKNNEQIIPDKTPVCWDEDANKSANKQEKSSRSEYNETFATDKHVQETSSSTDDNKNVTLSAQENVCSSQVSHDISPSAIPLPPTTRKRTASYAFVSSEPESNNNKSLYGDAYGSEKVPKVESGESCFAAATEYEDKDYIFENPYLVEIRYDENEYKDYYGDQMFENNKQDGRDDQAVLDMEYSTRRLIRQRARGDLSNQETQIVIKEMKKTADFTMPEYNSLATDLNRDVNDYCRSRRHRSSSSDVERWRITRHLELTCEYVLLKLRQELHVDPWTNRRIRTFSNSSGGNINQTLLNMSMGGGARARRNSENLTKQQLACVHDLKDLVERVLNPKHGKKVKICNITSLFYTIKQKFTMDAYEREILDYGIETMREAAGKDQPANSPEVVRCLQEVCDLVKQMTLQRNQAQIVSTHEVPSLLDLEVSPPIKSRLFSKSMAEEMKSILSCLMSLYRKADENRRSSSSEPVPSTSTVRDEGSTLHVTEPFSPESEKKATFLFTTNSGSKNMEQLPVINTFALGTTYDYSKKGDDDASVPAKSELDEELEGTVNCAARDIDSSKSVLSPKTKNGPENSIDDPSFLAEDNSNRNVTVEQADADASKHGSDTSVVNLDTFYKEAEVVDVSLICSNKDYQVEVTLNQEDLNTNKVASVVTTVDSVAGTVHPETNYAENATLKDCSPQSEGSITAINPKAEKQTGNIESENTVNQCDEYKGSRKEDGYSLETILEYTYPTDEDELVKINLTPARSDEPNSHDTKTCRNENTGLETGVDYSIQDDNALDLSMHKETQS